MRIQRNNPILCGACHHKFRAELVMDCPVRLFTASMRETRCPKCGAGYKKLFLITEAVMLEPTPEAVALAEETEPTPTRWPRQS